MGAQPALEVLAKENEVTIIDHMAGTRTVSHEEDPLSVPQRLGASWKPVRCSQFCLCLNFSRDVEHVLRAQGSGVLFCWVESACMHGVLGCFAMSVGWLKVMSHDPGCPGCDVSTVRGQQA